MGSCGSCLWNPVREFKELKRRVSRCVPSDPKQLASFCGESSAPQRVARVAETWAWAWGWDLAALATVVCEGTGGGGLWAQTAHAKCGSSEAVPAAGVRRGPGASYCGGLIHGDSLGFFSLPADKHQVCAKEQRSWPCLVSMPDTETCARHSL